MQQSFLLALLATTALGAPTKPQKHHHYGNLGSFKVPTNSRPDVLTNVDTLRDMKNALSKYNFDISDFTANLANFKDVKTTVKSSAAKVDTLSLPDFKDIPDTLDNIGNALSSFLFGGPPPPVKTYQGMTTYAAPKTTTVKKYKTSAVVSASAKPVYYTPSASAIPLPGPTSSAAAVYTPPTSSAAPTTSLEASSAAPSPVYTPETTSTVLSSVYVAPTSIYVPETTTAAPVPPSYTPVTTVPVTSALPIPTTLVTTYLPSNAFEPVSSEGTTSTSATPATPATSKKAAGTVQATPEQNQSEYLAPVTVGGQSLTLNFDTGSADFWVFSNQLTPAQIGGHSAFDPSKSSTWQADYSSTWKISYGDGSSASGNVGYDTVVIGGATATRQAVELATTVSASFANDTNNDGLVGLAFSSLNTITPNKQKTFFENIMNDLEQPLFTADLRTDASSTYEFGTIDPNKYTGDIHSTPIDNSKGFWQFASTTYTVGGNTYQNAQGSPAIADTGTSICLLDNVPVQTYYNNVPGAKFSPTAGGYIYPCTATLPDFGMVIGTSGFTAVIPGNQVTYAALGDGTCFGGIQSNQGTLGYQILGDTLLKQYFAVFNGGAKTFGLATKK